MEELPAMCGRFTSRVEGEKSVKDDSRNGEQERRNQSGDGDILRLVNVKFEILM